MSRVKRTLAMFVVTIVAFLLGAATVVVAAGDPVYRTGSSINKVRTATNTIDFEATDTPGVDLPGARLRFKSDTSALMLARFTTAINCSGAPGRCHAEVVVLDNNNGDAQVATIWGVSHLDSTFGDEGHESHLYEGSLRLPPGDYDFQVRLSTALCCDATGSITLHIPMWHFTMERSV